MHAQPFRLKGSKLALGAQLGALRMGTARRLSCLAHCGIMLPLQLHVARLPLVRLGQSQLTRVLVRREAHLMCLAVRVLRGLSVALPSLPFIL